MIQVHITYHADKVQSITLKGHANSDTKGHDLICAAVSSIITGGANALQDIDNFDIKLESGNASIKVKNTLSVHDEIVLETIVTELQTVAEDNNDFIQIKIL